jgi:hypothetical protein
MRFVLIILVICKVSISQNLVPNPSFENYSTCPNSWAQVSYAFPWSNPLTNSADYFNSCSTSSYSVPKAGSGYQFAKSGNAFVGLFTYNGIGFNYREYIQTQLNGNLTLNSFYLVKFYCNSMGMFTYATNNIALNFSSVAINNTSTGNVLSLIPNVYKFTNPVIDDSTNWVEIIGIYKSVGNEAYITIGNFKNDVTTDTFNLGNINYKGAYYYIDDVSVEPICTPFWSYRDTTVAIGDSVLIGPAITGLNINWYDATSTLITNAPGIYVKPAQTTTYTAVEDFCGNTYTNTIVVTVTPTAVKEYENNALQISLHPNPANNKFTIVTDEAEATLNILISDVQGKKLQEATANVENYEVGLQVNLPNGIYIVSIRNNTNYKTSIKKLVIQK